VLMGYINNIHIIEVYGVIEKLPETEHEPRANDQREYPQKPTSGLIEEDA
jgi:hypothetical protein